MKNLIWDWEGVGEGESFKRSIYNLPVEVKERSAESKNLA